MAVDFTPERGSYKELTPFRYWCQKVLPLVYDDSISYYELLCKVVNYLNITMEDVSTLNDDVTAVFAAYTQLQNYVNNYFDNLDVQQEINAKLDDMVTDGTMSTLIEPFVTSQIGGVVANQIGDVVADQIGETVAGQIGGVVATQLPAVADPRIKAATQEWLNANITQPTTPVIDKTLTFENQAAEAKAAGIKFAELANMDGLNPVTGWQYDTYPDFELDVDTGAVIGFNGLYSALTGAKTTLIGVTPGQTFILFTRGITQAPSYIFMHSSTGAFQYEPVEGHDWRGEFNKTYTALVLNVPENADTLIITTSEIRLDSFVVNPDYTAGLWQQLTALKADLSEHTKNLIALLNVDKTSNGVRIVSESWSGKVTASGTATAAGFINITDDITLDAGTYTISPNASNHLYFQVRSTEGTYIEQTGVGVNKTFTLSEATTVKIRATWTASFNETAEAYPQMESGSSATYFLPHMIADDDYARYMIGKLDDKALKFCGTLTNGADFNSADKIGYYLTSFSASYVNDPISGTNHRKALINIASQESVPFIVQFLLNYDSANTILYYRIRSAGNWTDWRLMYRQTDVETLKSNVSNLLGLASDNTVITNTDMVVSSSPANVGTNITVMSYNVANYNDDTSTYISDAKRTNFRKMLSQINPDFIGLQEAKEYIDDSNTHNAMDYIYRPMFPSHIIGSGGSILAKQGAPDTYDNMAFSNGRNLLFGRYAVGNKKLVMITAHPVAGTDSSAVSARLTQYTELIQFANREIQLTSADGRRTKYCPEWDYCIICGDFNSITDDDKTNLKSLASGGGYTMANGGWIGWLETARNASGSIVSSIDNILCSSNIIINSICSHKGMYNDLYSDHYPLSAEVTLLS